MRQALTIALKDLRLRVRDRSAFIVGIVAPLGLAAIFSFAFNPIENFDFTATYAVLNEDRSDVAAQFEQALSLFAEQTGAEIIEVDSRQEAIELVDVEPFTEGGADAVFVIPAGFSQAVATAGEAELQVIAGQGGVGAGVAVAIADQFAAELTYARVAVATFEELGGSDDRFEAGVRALAVPAPVAVADLQAGDRLLDGTTFYAAGLAIFFLFFTVQFGVNSLLEERHAGTLSRLLAAPFARSWIILGKALMAFVLGLISMIVLVAATTILFGASWGNPFGVLMLVAAGIVAALGVMAIVSAFAKTAEQAGNYSAMVAVILGFLGGTFFPVSQAGGFLASARFVSPHAWFMQGLGDMATGDVGNALPAVGAMLLFGAITGAVAVVMIRRGLRA